MKKCLLSLLAIGLLFAAPAKAVLAQEAAAKMQPVVVISVAPYDELFHDLEYIGQVSDNPDLAKGFEGLLAMFTQWQGLAGLDKTRPIGAAVTTDGAQFQVLGFVPVKDLKKLFGALVGLIGAPEEAGEGISRIQTNGIPMYVKEKDGWAFIAQSPDNLTELPGDPLKLLGGLNTEYDVAVRAYLQNIPQIFRQMAMDAIKQGVQAGMQRQAGGDEDNAQKQLSNQLVEKQMNELVTALNEMDQITLGWAIDSKGKRTLLDMSMTALPGSKIAKQMTAPPKEASGFEGFLQPHSLLKMHFNSAIAADDAQNMVEMMHSLKKQLDTEIEKSDDLEDDERDEVKDLVDEGLEVLVDTLKTGIVNGGAVVTGSGPFTLAAGGYVDGGDDLEEVFKKVLKLAKKHAKGADVPTIKFDVDKYESVRFHTISGAIPKSNDDQEELLTNILGDSIVLTLGFGSESVYLAVGGNGIETIKKVIDDSDETKPADKADFELAVALAPIVKFASEQKNANPILALVAEGLKQSGKDEILLTGKPMTNGVVYRLEAQEGVLRLIGSMAKMAANRGGAGGL